MNKVELAYWAGLFDGEGHISILPRYDYYKGRRLGPYYVLELGVTSCYFPHTDQLAEEWGGSKYQQPRRKPHHKQRQQWKLTGIRAYEFLKTIRPYLREKAEQANVAMAFWEIKGHHPGKRLSSEKKSLLEDYWRHMKSLHH